MVVFRVGVCVMASEFLFIFGLGEFTLSCGKFVESLFCGKCTKVCFANVGRVW